MEHNLNPRRPTYWFVLQTAFIVARSPNFDTALDNIADIRNQRAEFRISSRTVEQFAKHKKLDHQGSQMSYETVKPCIFPLAQDRKVSFEIRTKRWRIWYKKKVKQENPVNDISTCWKLLIEGIAKGWQVVTCTPIVLQSCFNLQDAGRLQVKINLENFWFCVYCLWRHNGCRFRHFWPTSSGSGRQTNESFMGSSWRFFKLG